MTTATARRSKEGDHPGPAPKCGRCNKTLIDWGPQLRCTHCQRNYPKPPQATTDAASTATSFDDSTVYLHSVTV